MELDATYTDAFSPNGDRRIHDGKAVFSKGFHYEMRKDLVVPAAETQPTIIMVTPGLTYNTRIWINDKEEEFDKGTTPQNSLQNYTMYTGDTNTRMEYNNDTGGTWVFNYSINSWRLVSSGLRIEPDDNTAYASGYFEAICVPVRNAGSAYNYNHTVGGMVLGHLDRVLGAKLTDNWSSHCSYRTGHINKLRNYSWDLPVANHDHPFKMIQKQKAIGTSASYAKTQDTDISADFYENCMQQHDASFHCWVIKLHHECKSGTDGTDPTISEVQSYYDYFLTQFNDIRTNPANYTWPGGTTPPAVPAVTWGEPLTLAAQWHTNDMITRDYFAHDGTTPGAPSTYGDLQGDRALNAGWGSDLYVTENLASVPSGETLQQQVDRVLQLWIDSGDLTVGTHNGNMMDTQIDHIGVGHRDGKWTLVMGDSPDYNLATTDDTVNHGVLSTTSSVAPCDRHYCLHSAHNLEYTQENWTQHLEEPAAQIGNNAEDNPAIDRKHIIEREHDDRYAKKPKLDSANNYQDQPIHTPKREKRKRDPNDAGEWDPHKTAETGNRAYDTFLKPFKEFKYDEKRGDTDAEWDDIEEVIGKDNPVGILEDEEHYLRHRFPENDRTKKVGKFTQAFETVFQNTGGFGGRRRTTARRYPARSSNYRTTARRYTPRVNRYQNMSYRYPKRRYNSNYYSYK